MRAVCQPPGFKEYLCSLNALVSESVKYCALFALQRGNWMAISYTSVDVESHIRLGTGRSPKGLLPKLSLKEKNTLIIVKKEGGGAVSLNMEENESN